jgi:methylase of polypeptide subunit release factors
MAAPAFSISSLPAVDRRDVLRRDNDLMLATVSNPVAPPCTLHDRQMLNFVSELRDSGYNLVNCAKRLDVFPRFGVNFWDSLRPEWKPQHSDLIDTLIELFIDGRQISRDRLTKHVSSEFVTSAIEMRLLQDSGQYVQSELCLFPCYGKYIATDRAHKNSAINQVMWLWGESFLLAGIVKRSPRRRAIDIGTGSGIHAILASDHSEHVVAADINPRALEFSRFNAALNGVHNVEFVLSDVFESLSGTCDLLLANPPYAPDAAATAGDNFWSGGEDGTEILERIVRAIPSRLDMNGECHINALFPNAPGTTTKDHFNRWLNGDLDHYEVLDHTWPVPHYEDLLSERPYRGDKSAWRFGIVSLRRSATGKRFWRECTGRGLFFGSAGTCSVLADFDVLE